MKRSSPNSSASVRVEIAESLHTGVAHEIDEIGADLAELIGRRALTPSVRTQLRSLLAKNNSLSLHLREEILHLRGLDQTAIARLKHIREIVPLTKKENEILQLLNQALTSKQIAASQFLSQATVKTHLASIYRKLGVTNKTAALESARNAGLIRPH